MGPRLGRELIGSGSDGGRVRQVRARPADLEEAGLLRENLQRVPEPDDRLTRRGWGP